MLLAPFRVPPCCGSEDREPSPYGNPTEQGGPSDDRGAKEGCSHCLPAAKGYADAVNALLRGAECYAYVCSDDRKLLYMSENLASLLHVERPGQTCHQTIFGLDLPCPWCPLDKEPEAMAEPRDVRSPVTGDWYALTVPRNWSSASGAEHVVLLRDINRCKNLQMALAEATERYRRLADYSRDCECWFGNDGELREVNAACERITGYRSDMFFKAPRFLESIMHKGDVERWRRFMDTEERDGEEPIEYRVFSKDGRMRWLCQFGVRVFAPDGEDLGMRCSIRDITDRKIREQELLVQARHDVLTGLPNRVLCLDRIQQAIARSRRRDGHHFAVVVMDLDRFRVVNNSLGKAVGDCVLQEIAARLEFEVRRLDTVSRFHGDEFVILLDELESSGEAIRIIKRIRNSLKEPIRMNGYELLFTASFGVVLNSDECKEADKMVQNATIAVNRARDKGCNRIAAYNSRMLEEAVTRMCLESDLRRSLQRKEYFVTYQPIVTLESMKLKGFEALVRWQHPTKGVVGPAEFIPLAEESGLILELGCWVLRQACETLAAWRRTHPGASSLVMSVNLSARQFMQPNLVDMVGTILEETGIPPRCLQLELTETSLISNGEVALSMLQHFKSLGIRISIDDFGTGYSSLSYLHRLPVDTLKVDRSFVSRVCESQENREIVRAVLDMARSLGLETVAEGVENKEHVCALRALGCDNVQGYYFSKPLDVDDSECLIAGSTGWGEASQATN